MSQWLRAVGLLVFLLMANATAAEKLRLVADPWPPFTDALLLNGGLATDIVNTALKRAGYTTLYEQVPWARALLGLSEGRHDVLINAWFSEDRKNRPVFCRILAQSYSLHQAQRVAHRRSDSRATAPLPDRRCARLCLFARIRQRRSAQKGPGSELLHGSAHARC